MVGIALLKKEGRSDTGGTVWRTLPHWESEAWPDRRTMRCYRWRLPEDAVQRKKDPSERISIGKLERFGAVFGWSDEDYLKIIKAKK